MRTLKGFMSGMLAIAAALLLRFGKGCVPRELITNLIGFEVRANIEHLLAAVGITLAGTFGFVLLHWLPEWSLAKIGYQLQGLKLTRRTKRLPSLDSIQGKLATMIISWVIGFAYICFSYRFESYQATISVYGHVARGHFQGWQFAADCIGTLAAVYITSKLTV